MLSSIKYFFLKNSVFLWGPLSGERGGGKGRSDGVICCNLRVTKLARGKAHKSKPICHNARIEIINVQLQKGKVRGGE